MEIRADNPHEVQPGTRRLICLPQVPVRTRRETGRAGISSCAQRKPDTTSTMCALRLARQSRRSWVAHLQVCLVEGAV